MTVLRKSACIVGLGPAGLGAALALARAGQREVLCLEAGVDAEDRACPILARQACRHSEPCQVISGVGGSSVLSAGKISGFPAGRSMVGAFSSEEALLESMNRAAHLLTEFLPLDFSMVPEQALRQQREFFERLGFNYSYYPSHPYSRPELLAAFRSMRATLTSAGVEQLLNARVHSIARDPQGFSLTCDHRGHEVHIVSRTLFLAVGRQGAPLVNSTVQALSLHSQDGPCDIGVRLEFPASIASWLTGPHNDLKLHFGAARTFCVCHRGTLAPYRLGSTFFMEGSADPASPTEFSNLAVMYRTQPRNGADLHASIAARTVAVSGGLPVRQHLSRFLGRSAVVPSDDLPSSITFWRPGDVNALYAPDDAGALRAAVGTLADRVWSASDQRLVTVFGPEIDSYWPRITLREGFGTAQPGLYIIGDAAGHGNGILQAFCAGMVAAERRLLDAVHA